MPACAASPGRSAPAEPIARAHRRGATRSHVRDRLRMHARTEKSSSLHAARLVSRPRAIGCGASTPSRCRRTRQQAVPCGNLPFALSRAPVRMAKVLRSTKVVPASGGFRCCKHRTHKGVEPHGGCKPSLTCLSPPPPRSTASTASARQACGTSTMCTFTPAPASRAIFATP